MVKDPLLILKYFDLYKKAAQIIGQLRVKCFVVLIFRQEFHHRHEPLVYACLFLLIFRLYCFLKYLLFGSTNTCH
jgi:hypothetical protein